MAWKIVPFYCISLHASSFSFFFFLFFFFLFEYSRLTAKTSVFNSPQESEINRVNRRGRLRELSNVPSAGNARLSPSIVDGTQPQD